VGCFLFNEDKKELIKREGKIICFNEKLFKDSDWKQISLKFKLGPEIERTSNWKIVRKDQKRLRIENEDECS
jgi:hypothetical protein